MIQNKILIFFILLVSLLLHLTQQQQLDDASVEDDDDDDCAFISGQHCDQNGICKYCAMCLQSSCILSKTIGNSPSTPSSCNTTQFGTTNLYNWYDYCLSSDNDSGGSYCATSTECYQYRKSAGPSVTYAWHNLTCNPSTCMLIASNGAPPPIPVPPQNSLPFDNNDNRIKKNNGSTTSDDISNATDNNSNRHHYYHDKHPFHNPAAIALTVVCSLVLAVAFCWLLRLCKKKGWWPFNGAQAVAATNSRSWKKKKRSSPQQLQTTTSHNSITSSIPSSNPPSFSSTPPDMAIIRHPHLHLYQHQQQQPSIHSARSSTASVEPLPSYLSPYPSPPKYEQAIVTQIRGLRDDSMGIGSSSSTDQYHHGNTAPLPSMWVPVYFTQQQNNFRRGVNGGELFGFTPNHSYWLQQLAPNNYQQISSNDGENNEQQQNQHPPSSSS